MATQWRVGPNGPIGLDYAALPAVMQMAGTPPDQWASAFNGFQVMEAEALKIIGENRG